MLPAASVYPLYVVLLLVTVSFHLSAAQSDVYDSNGSRCPVAHDDDQSCPVNCLLYDPVCGEDGEMYDCGCLDAACAGVRVVKMGPCEVDNGVSGAVSRQAFFLIHIVWLIVLGFSVLCGFL